MEEEQESGTEGSTRKGPHSSGPVVVGREPNSDVRAAYSEANEAEEAEAAEFKEGAAEVAAAAGAAVTGTSVERWGAARMVMVKNERKMSMKCMFACCPGSVTGLVV